MIYVIERCLTLSSGSSPRAHDAGEADREFCTRLKRVEVG